MLKKVQHLIHHSNIESLGIESETIMLGSSQSPNSEGKVILSTTYIKDKQFRTP